jgi:hypothetical protein
MDLTMMERDGDRWEKMEGSCSTGQNPQRAVVPLEEEVDVHTDSIRGLASLSPGRDTTF